MPRPQAMRLIPGARRVAKSSNSSSDDYPLVPARPVPRTLSFIPTAASQSFVDSVSPLQLDLMERLAKKNSGDRNDRFKVRACVSGSSCCDVKSCCAKSCYTMFGAGLSDKADQDHRPLWRRPPRRRDGG